MEYLDVTKSLLSLTALSFSILLVGAHNWKNVDTKSSKSGMVWLYFSPSNQHLFIPHAV
jgi:hypothetical protein